MKEYWPKVQHQTLLGMSPFKITFW